MTLHYLTPDLYSADAFETRVRERFASRADVLTAIRTGVRVEALGRAAQANAEQRLRSEADLRRIFKGHEDAVDRAGEIAARCLFP